MKEKFWKKADYVIGLIPLMAIFAVLVVSANIEIKDLDLWLHIAMGKFITVHRFIPDTDILSASIQGTPWINHEWFFQLIVFNIFNAWGSEGLIMMQVVIVTVTMLLLFLLGYNKERQLVTTVILFLVYMVYQQRFTMRPDLYSLLFFTIFIFALSLHIDKKWVTPLLFIVQVLWSNMHGFFFFGPLFVLIGIVSEFIKRNIRLPYEWNDSGRLTDDEYNRMKRIFFFILLACIFNPYFVQGAWYPISIFFSFSGENKIFFQYIQELQKPITWATLFSSNHYLYYKIMIFLSCISFFFNRRKIDISALLFWFVFLLFSLNAKRNTPYFAFAAYLVIVTNLLNINYKDIVPIRFTERKFFYLTTIILKILFVIWIIGYYQAISLRSYYDFDKYELKSEYGGISKRSYPDKAVDFLVEHKVRGNIFNDFNSGAYLLGRTFPDIKVFIDGRTEVYGGAFFKQYQKIWEQGNVELFEQVVERYQLSGALLNATRHHIPKKILNYLYNHKDWHMVYFNYDAVIFLKDVDHNKKLIDQFKINLAQWSTAVTDIHKLGTIRVMPYQSYFRGYTLESLDLDEPALNELMDALRVDPMYSDVHDLIGKIYTKRNEYQKAFEHFRIAVSASPRKKDKRHNLALSYLDLEEYKGAIDQYKAILKMWPADPKGYFLLTKAYILDRQFSEAVNILTQAHTLSPSDIKDILELGDLMFQEKAYSQAQTAYKMGLDTKKELVTVHKKLGYVALAINDRQQAKMEFQHALSVDPDDEEAMRLLEENQ